MNIARRHLTQKAKIYLDIIDVKQWQDWSKICISLSNKLQLPE